MSKTKAEKIMIKLFILPGSILKKALISNE
jgi:hypothetical protein